MKKKLNDPQAFDTCLIYVATDGLENASKHHSCDDIKELIANAETVYNIKVVYLGANQDAILEAGNIGISQNSAINYSETQENVEAVYRGSAGIAFRDRSFPTVHPSFSQIERQASLQSSPPSPMQYANITGMPVLTRQYGMTSRSSLVITPFSAPSVVRQESC